ncbi:MAG: DUF11 domain-containing protein [Chloroflexi bacterium]|nr:DUF11 domain-containing protein [Chloroflexota bacterium]
MAAPRMFDVFLRRVGGALFWLLLLSAVCGVTPVLSSDVLSPSGLLLVSDHLLNHPPSDVLYRPDVDGFLQQNQFTASDLPNGNEAGYTISSANDIVAIGVPGDADRGTDAGSVYVFLGYRDAGTYKWRKEAKLTAPDAMPGDRFGTAIAVGGDRIVVGAPGKNSGQGAAYIFARKDGGYENMAWVLEYSVSIPDGASGDAFGSAVGYGDAGFNLYRAVIGAPGKNSGQGVAYVYEISHSVAVPTWYYQATLTAGDGVSGDRFGTSLFALRTNEGHFIAVGAPGNDEQADNAGSVYVFTMPTPGVWSQEDKLVAADSQTGDGLGMSLEFHLISGPTSSLTIMAGAPNADVAATDAGAVFLFSRNYTTFTWAQTATMTAGDATADDHFGASIDRVIWYAVIGAPGKNSGQGQAYTYSYDSNGSTWTPLRTYASGNPIPGGNAASGVAIDDDYVIFGAPFESVDGIDAGMVYSYTGPSSYWNTLTPLSVKHDLAGDQFASSFAVDNDYAIAGGAGDDDGGFYLDASGAAYIFVRSGGVWSQQVRLTLGDSGRKGRFAQAVAISGDTALISGAGATWVYVRNGDGWIQQAKLNYGSRIALEGDVALIGGSGDRYFYRRVGTDWSLQNTFTGVASSVALDGEWAVVGTGTSAEIYRWNGTTWASHTNLPARDGLASTNAFGQAVDVNGTTVAVGVPRYSTSNVSEIGAVYIYSFNGTAWGFQQRLIRTTTSQMDRLGTSVSLEGNRLAAGMASPYGSEHAIVFRYWGTSWKQVEDITRRTGTDKFGATVTLENGELWVTAPANDANTLSDSGTVFLYQYTPEADLSIDSTGTPSTVVIDSHLGYEITVSNNGQDNTSGVTVTNTLSPLVTLDSMSQLCTAAGQVVTCTIGDLQVGASVTIQIGVTVTNGSSGQILLVSSVSSALPDPNTGNNSTVEQTTLVVTLPQPALLTPVNGSSTTDNTPLFTWNGNPGAVLYQVQLDIVDPPLGTYTGFNSGATFTPPSPLLYMRYYWRVRALDRYGIPSPWSATWTLDVNSPTSAAPTLYSYTTSKPTLSWNPVSWATGYQVQIGIDSNFATYVITSAELEPASLSYIPDEPLLNGTWYWRLRVRKPDGLWTGYGSAQAFAVIKP